MLSLHALLAAHRTLLVLDAASARIQVGLLRHDASPSWESDDDEAGAALFALIEKLFARASADTPTAASFTLAAVDAFAFCDGPGSILGIRTSAVALRTWHALAPRPIFSFRSLAVVGHALARTENLRDFSVIADARRDTWHRLHVSAAGELSALERAPAATLAGTLITPENFRHWATPPAGLRRVPYDLDTLFPIVADAPLFTPTHEPEAFLHDEPSYATWEPQVHRAPPAKAST
jgi:tRNA threonylcarbamoyladenosine biosynthesis protein TsaB